MILLRIIGHILVYMMTGGTSQSPDSSRPRPRPRPGTRICRHIPRKVVEVGRPPYPRESSSHSMQCALMSAPFSRACRLLAELSMLFILTLQTASRGRTDEQVLSSQAWLGPGEGVDLLGVGGGRKNMLESGKGEPWRRRYFHPRWVTWQVRMRPMVTLFERHPPVNFRRLIGY